MVLTARVPRYSPIMLLRMGLVVEAWHPPAAPLAETSNPWIVRKLGADGRFGGRFGCRADAIEYLHREMSSTADSQLRCWVNDYTRQHSVIQPAAGSRV